MDQLISFPLLYSTCPAVYSVSTNDSALLQVVDSHRMFFQHSSSRFAQQEPVKETIAVEIQTRHSTLHRSPSRLRTCALRSEKFPGSGASVDGYPG